MSANIGAKDIVTDGLILYLDVANYKSYTSGSTVWRDLSPSNYSGSIVNSPVFNGANLGSIVFDGVDDYVRVSNNGVFNTSETTWGLWFYRTRSTNEGLMTTEDGVSSGKNGYTFRNRGGGGMIFGLGYYGNGDSISGFFPSINTWYYLTGTKSSSTLTFYVNGRYIGQTNTVRSVDSTYPLTIGKLEYTVPENFSGSISSLHIYNRALSAAEILQNYNAQKGRFGLT